MSDYNELRDKLMHTNGTTAYETISVILPSVLLTFIATSVIVSNHNVKKFFIEFFIIILPSIFTITVTVQYLHEILIILLSICMYIHLFNKHACYEKKINCSKRNFITNARATINMLSVIAILGVDFKIFPRRFAKTETYGFSLMDVGVGLFIYSNGIVAPEIKGRKDSLFKTLKSIIPLLALGCARFFVTKEIDYHVPVSEYGVHWNFFITLAVTKVICSLILCCINIDYIFINAILIVAAHECMLQIGLADFVFSDVKRTSFLTANREGIISSLGYVALYFLSVSLGKLLYTKNNLFLKLISLSTCLLVITFLLENQFGVSRRLANAGYCSWVLFIGVFMTSLFYLSEIIQENMNTVPFIFDAINYNGLIFFLLCNLLTGAVNIIFDTLKLNNLYSLIILIMYMFFATSIVSILYVKQIRLKL